MKNMKMPSVNLNKYFSINNLIYLIILIVACAISTPFLKNGFYTVHDDQQISRLFLFDQSLFSGQFPPRWVNSLGFGFGYPLFIFYPPFIYIVGEVFHLLGFGFITSIKLVFFSSIVLSGIAMYIFAKDTFGKLAGLIGAIFYIFAPYRALDIYVRGALAESFSFVWLPLILWSFRKLENTKKFIYIFTSSTLLSLLMITHNLIFLPFAIILSIFLFFQLVTSKNKLQSALFYLASIFFALCLSAFFWIPSLSEKKYTLVDQILLTELADFKIHFVYLIQLWNWPWGFGGSAPGIMDGLSFKIGKIHIIASAAAVLISLLFFVKNKIKVKNINLHLLSITVLFLFSAFMTTFYSEFIWRLIPQLAYLQFPWRFLTFTTLFSSYLVAALIYQLKLPILKLVAAFTLLSLVVIPNYKLFKPQYYRDFLTDQKATDEHYINWYVSSSSFEYAPWAVELKKTELGTSFPNITEAEIPKKPVETIDNPVQIDIIKSKPGELLLKTNSNEQATLKVNTFNFPGWEASIDGKKTQIIDDNKLKLITLKVPSGQHAINVTFKNTPIITAANYLSLGSVIFLILFCLKLSKKKISH